MKTVIIWLLMVSYNNEPYRPVMTKQPHKTEEECELNLELENELYKYKCIGVMIMPRKRGNKTKFNYDNPNANEYWFKKNVARQRKRGKLASKSRKKNRGKK